MCPFEKEKVNLIKEKKKKKKSEMLIDYAYNCYTCCINVLCFK